MWPAAGNPTDGCVVGSYRRILPELRAESCQILFLTSLPICCLLFWATHCFLAVRVESKVVITEGSCGLQAVANGDVDLVGQAWQQVHTGDVHPDIDTLNALLK